MTKVRVLMALAAAAAGYGLFLAIAAPPEAVQRTYARILHIHAPSAWLAFLAFFVTAFGSIMWRFRRKMFWDRLAFSSAEIGVLFTAVALVCVVAACGSPAEPADGEFAPVSDPQALETVELAADG